MFRKRKKRRDERFLLAMATPSSFSSAAAAADDGGDDDDAGAARCSLPRIRRRKRSSSVPLPPPRNKRPRPPTLHNAAPNRLAPPASRASTKEKAERSGAPVNLRNLRQRKDGKDTGMAPPLSPSPPTPPDLQDSAEETATVTGPCVSVSPPIPARVDLPLARRQNKKSAASRQPIPSPLGKCLKRALKKGRDGVKSQPIPHQGTRPDKLTAEDLRSNVRCSRKGGSCSKEGAESHRGAHSIEDRDGSLSCAGINRKGGLLHSPVVSQSGKSHEEDLEALEQGKSWTSEQVMALQNAYFEVLPSPNFWFEVSRKVTGKTAKECFDRYYSSYPTPPATQSHGRSRCESGLTMRTISFTNSPMRCISGSTSRFSRGKQGLLRAHRTVRNILRKQKVADGGYEADIFSAVEKGEEEEQEEALPSSSLYRPDLVVPSSLLSSSGSADKERGFLNQLHSPEVLKRETNPTRLDRYLDMLHLRRANKKGRNDDDDEVRSTGSISAARNAIITGAQEILERVSKEKEKAGVEYDESDVQDEGMTDMSDEDLC